MTGVAREPDCDERNDSVKTNATTRRFFYFILMVVLAGQGCIPALSEIKDEGEEQSRIYQMPIQVVWDAVPLMVKELGPVMVDENKKRGYFLAENKMSTLSHGERILIVVEKVDAVNTKVKIQSKRIWMNDAAAKRWEIPMLNKLDVMLGQRQPRIEKKEE